MSPRLLHREINVNAAAACTWRGGAVPACQDVITHAARSVACAPGTVPRCSTRGPSSSSSSSCWWWGSKIRVQLSSSLRWSPTTKLVVDRRSLRAQRLHDRPCITTVNHLAMHFLLWTPANSPPPPLSFGGQRSVHKVFDIHSVRWRHSNLQSHYDLYVVEQRGVLCEVKWWRFIALFEKLNQLVQENVRIITILLRKWCDSNIHLWELAPHSGGKTAGTDTLWRNYVTVTLCIQGSVHKIFNIQNNFCLN